MSTGVPDGISVDDFFLEFRLLCCISALSGSKEMYDFVVSNFSLLAWYYHFPLSIFYKKHKNDLLVKMCYLILHKNGGLIITVSLL